MLCGGRSIEYYSYVAVDASFEPSKRSGVILFALHAAPPNKLVAGSQYQLASLITVLVILLHYGWRQQKEETTKRQISEEWQ